MGRSDSLIVSDPLHSVYPAVIGLPETGYPVKGGHPSLWMGSPADRTAFFGSSIDFLDASRLPAIRKKFP